MAEIAQPYEEAGAERAQPEPSVSFNELVEAWVLRDQGPAAEARYRDLRTRFEQEHGEIMDAYVCETAPMAVALTAVRPHRATRLRFNKERMAIFSETERLISLHPELAPILHRAELQYVSVRHALRGLSQRLLVNWLFVWIRDLMISAPPGRNGETVPLSKEAIEAHGRELDVIAADYAEAADREAQIVYLAGMLYGVGVLCALMLPVGILLAGTDVPVDLTTFFGCLISGALGALVSVVTRMSSNKFHLRHEVGRAYVQRVAAFRPFIGSVFGLLVYFALQGGVIRQLDIPEDEGARFAFFLVLAFTAGFSERAVKEVLRAAEVRAESRPEQPPERVAERSPSEPLQVQLIRPPAAPPSS